MKSSNIFKIGGDQGHGGGQEVTGGLLEHEGHCVVRGVPEPVEELGHELKNLVFVKRAGLDSRKKTRDLFGATDIVLYPCPFDIIM